MSTPFDAAAFADRILLEQSNLVRERFEDGTVVYYDFRLAEPEVNSPGPEIAVIPGTLGWEMSRALEIAVRRETVFAAMRAEPSLAALAPPPADLAVAWISDEDGKDVAIVLGRGDDGRAYIVDREKRSVKRSVKRIEEDGLISGEFDLHDRPFSEISKEKYFGVGITP